MKQHIKDLAFSVIKNPCNPFPETGIVGDIHCFDDEELLHFVKLIVRECAARGSKAMYPDSDPDYVGRKIREHFGVDE